jgi:hypothetical protein
VEPAGRGPVEMRAPHPGATVRPRLRVPQRAGGLALVGAKLLRGPCFGYPRWVLMDPTGVGLMHGVAWGGVRVSAGQTWGDVGRK